MSNEIKNPTDGQAIALNQTNSMLSYAVGQLMGGLVHRIVKLEHDVAELNKIVINDEGNNDE